MIGLPLIVFGIIIIREDLLCYKFALADMRRFKNCCHLTVSGYLRLGNNVITSRVYGCALFRLFERKGKL